MVVCHVVEDYKNCFEVDSEGYVHVPLDDLISDQIYHEMGFNAGLWK